MNWARLIYFHSVICLFFFFDTNRCDSGTWGFGLPWQFWARCSGSLLINCCQIGVTLATDAIWQILFAGLEIGGILLQGLWKDSIKCCVLLGEFWLCLEIKVYTLLPVSSTPSRTGFQVVSLWTANHPTFQILWREKCGNYMSKFPGKTNKVKTKTFESQVFTSTREISARR